MTPKIMNCVLRTQIKSLLLKIQKVCVKLREAKLFSSTVNVTDDGFRYKALIIRTEST